MYGIYDKGGVFLSIGPGWTSNCFDFHYPENALCIYCIYQKDGQSNLFLDAIEAQRGE